MTQRVVSLLGLCASILALTVLCLGEFQPVPPDRDHLLGLAGSGPGYNILFSGNCSDWSAEGTGLATDSTCPDYPDGTECIVCANLIGNYLDESQMNGGYYADSSLLCGTGSTGFCDFGTCNTMMGHSYACKNLQYIRLE